MTSSDDARDEPTPSGADLPLDEDAAWRAIVANYGDRPVLDDPAARPEPARPEDVTDPVAPPVAPLEAAAREPETEHFVPPEPPPIPRPTPARRLAWTGLFGPPLVLILAVVVGWTFPMWASVLLVASFIGGFVFLVATMPRDQGMDGDDGAVV